MRTYNAAIIVAASLLAGFAAHGEPPQPDAEIEVTATRVPESVDQVPAYISILHGDDLRARDATDLRTLLSGVAGVEAPPGGDAGPASAVPSFWGLHEFDAFLLVVDGVPLGGAFNPAIPDLDLTNVERVEVLKGSAPVLYGADLVRRRHSAPASARRPSDEPSQHRWRRERQHPWLGVVRAANGRRHRAILLDRRSTRRLFRPARDRPRGPRALPSYRAARRRRLPARPRRRPDPLGPAQPGAARRQRADHAHPVGREL